MKKGLFFENFFNIVCAVGIFLWVGQAFKCGTFVYGGGDWRLVLVVWFLGFFHIAV